MIPPVFAYAEGVQLRVEPGGEVHGKFRLDTGEKFDCTQLHVQPLPLAENATGGSVAAVMGISSGQASSGSLVVPTERLR